MTESNSSNIASSSFPYGHNFYSILTAHIQELTYIPKQVPKPYQAAFNQMIWFSPRVCFTIISKYFPLSKQLI